MIDDSEDKDRRRTGIALLSHPTVKPGGERLAALFRAQDVAVEGNRRFFAGDRAGALAAMDEAHDIYASMGPDRLYDAACVRLTRAAMERLPCCQMCLFLRIPCAKHETETENDHDYAAQWPQDAHRVV